MSKTIFTPGPWTAEAIMSDEKHDICLVNPNKPVSETGWPVVIASVYSDNDEHGIGKAEADANARLITAAPELLEAACLQEKADSHWANCQECEGSACPELGCEAAFLMADDARIMRRAAIRKATEVE